MPLDHVASASEVPMTPIEKGVAAAQVRMEQDANPYRPESWEYDDWEAGYEAAVEADEAMEVDYY